MDVSNHLNYQIILFLIIYMVVGLQVSKAQDTEFWNNLARETLRKRKDVKINTNKAKNVILFLGDGMGVSSITAGRILKGQRQGMLGEEASLVFDEFPHIGLAKTYNTDETVADSAGTATAFLCGVKSKYGTIGVDDNIIRYNCSTVNKSKLSCIGDWALMSGKGAGVVTNMRVTHATPSPLYAASAERYWEHDGLSDKNCDDIAKQLVQNYPGKNLQVILGGGRTNFFPNTMADFEYKNMTGNRLDGVNLVDKWKAMKTKENVTHAFVWNKEQFDKVDPKKIRNLFGLFEPNHMKDITTMVNKDGTLKSERDPTLAEMTEKAIGVLQNNKNGFFLLVEGGLIDHFHHKNLAVRAISEVVEFDKAIEIALNITNSEETLIIVTADHSQSMQLNGYPKRGAPLFGTNSVSNGDNLPYTSLLYTTGPGYNHSGINGSRPNLTTVDTSANDYVYQTAIPRSSATHVGEDVVSYAQGPMAHLVAGVYEQNYIAHVMAYAARIGPYSDLKTSNSAKVNNLKASLSTGNSLQNVHSLYILTFSFTFMSFTFFN